MADKVIKCSILTPEACLFEGEISATVLPTVDGEWMIGFNHAPMVLMLGLGNLRLQNDSGWQHYYIESGIAQVQRNELSILCEFALGKDDLSQDSLEEELKGLEAQNPGNVQEQVTLRLQKQKVKTKLKVLNPGAIEKH